MTTPPLMFDDSENYPAFHPHWKGHFILFPKSGRLLHFPSGQGGDYLRDGDDLSVNWDKYGEEKFVFCNDAFYSKQLPAAGMVINNIHYHTPASLQKEKLEKRAIKGHDVKIYIMHYTPLADRKNFQDAQLAYQNLTNISYITEYDQEQLGDNILEKTVSYDKDEWEQRVQYFENRFKEQNQYSSHKTNWNQDVSYEVTLNIPFAELRRSEISLCMKHYTAMRKMVESNDEFALLLEDDGVLAPRFGELIDMYLSETPSNWDIIFIGSAQGLQVPGRCADTLAYRVDPPRIRCSDSILIKKEAARKISDNMLPIVHPVDYEFLYWMNKLGLICYWWEPGIVMQGSQTGLFGSSVQIPA